MFLYAVALSTSTVGGLPTSLFLHCSAVDAQRKERPIEIKFENVENPQAFVSFSFGGEEQVKATRIIDMENLLPSNERETFQFYIEGGAIPLIFRLIKNDERWGMEAGPAVEPSESYVYGPLLTGSCQSMSRTSFSGLSVEDSSALPEFESAPGPMGSYSWVLPAIEKNCKVISSDRRTLHGRITVGPDGGLIFTDWEGDKFRGNFKETLQFSFAGIPVLIKDLRLQSASKEYRLSLRYRQGRFWVDGNTQSELWFRGVCTSAPLEGAKP